MDYGRHTDVPIDETAKLVSVSMTGVFGNELPVADVTDPQTRLLALVGRRV
jgi:hypothetical protein